MLEAHTPDSPQADGRQPQAGEARWSLLIPLDGDRRLILHMGLEGLENLHCSVRQALQEVARRKAQEIGV